MKIALCYDTKLDYGFSANNLEYTDFVGLDTVEEIKMALENNGHNVSYVGNAQKLFNALKQGSFDVDLIFNIAEGFASRNREALVPALSEICNLKCTASDTFAMTLNLNKHFTKVLLNSIGILSPKGFVYDHIDNDIIEQANQLGYPIVIKPNSEGGSMGLYLIKSVEDFIVKSKLLISKYNYELLAEEYIDGEEITVPIIQKNKKTMALGVVAIKTEEGKPIDLYDNSLKYVDNVINTLDVNCSNQIKKNIMKDSVRIFDFFKLNDYSRMDFRLKNDGTYYFLEINTMPSLCRNGSFEKCANKIGLEYSDIIEMIVQSAINRYN